MPKDGQLITMMITPEKKEFIKANHKWQFNWSDFFSRYFIIVGPIGITFIGLSMFYGGFKFGHLYNNNFMNPFFLAAICSLLFGLFFTYYTIKRIETERRFHTLTIPDSVSFTEISDRIQKLNWTIIGKEKEVIQASTKTSPFSWGECVTIIKGKDASILINTQPLGRQPFTLNGDRRNIQKIKYACK